MAHIWMRDFKTATSFQGIRRQKLTIAQIIDFLQNKFTFRKFLFLRIMLRNNKACVNQNRACDAISWQIKTKTKKISKKDLFDYNFSILVPCLALDPTDDALEMKLINPATGLEVPNTRFLDFKTGFEIFDAEYNFHNGKVECVATYRNRTDSASFYLIFEFSNQW